MQLDSKKRPKVGIGVCEFSPFFNLSHLTQRSKKYNAVMHLKIPSTIYMMCKNSPASHELQTRKAACTVAVVVAVVVRSTKAD